LFKAFFKALGYEGLCEIVTTVRLNMNIDFFHNMLLESDEVQYFMALYDFCLQEHAIQLTHPILKLLHVPFQNPYQMGICCNTILNAIDPSSYAYVVDDNVLKTLFYR
jgi:hypothetical protein